LSVLEVTINMWYKTKTIAGEKPAYIAGLLTARDNCILREDERWGHLLKNGTGPVEPMQKVNPVQTGIPMLPYLSVSSAS